MAVAALSTAGFSGFIAASSDVSASDQAWQALQQSLASGNLTAAQSAFNSYQQLNQPENSSGSSSSNSQLATDLTALGTAIGSGNLSSAQSAFATVQNDLKSSPPQSVTNAESAVNQTVGWVDDLLNLTFSTDFTAPTTAVDPSTAILDEAYGLNPYAPSTDPTTSILDSAYGVGTSATPSAASTGGSSTASASSSTVASGNSGSSASVNAYA
jgi:hypothetical protein